MGYLVLNRGGGSNKVSFSGTQYLNPDKGTKRLCIRTGTKPNDIIKYGLTTNSSASEYCGMRMKIDGNTAYIGRSEAPIQSWYITNSLVSSSKGTSAYQSYYSTMKFTYSYSSTVSGRALGGRKYGTRTYSNSYITSVNDKRCTYIDNYVTGTMYTSCSTHVTLARNSTVGLSKSINYGTHRMITRTVSFEDPIDPDENNFNI